MELYVMKQEFAVGKWMNRFQELTEMDEEKHYLLSVKTS
jgi:hypothetical protein